jgi:hypothetical protein
MVRRGRADGWHLTDTSANAAGGRASFCLVRQTLRLSQAQAAVDQAAAVVRMDARSELACDGFSLRRLLACHTTAPRPPKYLTAGHRPRASA